MSFKQLLNQNGMDELKYSQKKEKYSLSKLWQTIGVYYDARYSSNKFNLEKEAIKK